MHAKWDLLIMAVAAAGSWMLAENTQRIDLGASDEEAVAAASAACGDLRARLYGWNQPTIMIVDEGFQVATDIATDAAAPPALPSDCSPK